MSRAPKKTRPAKQAAPTTGRPDKKSQILDVASEWFLAHGYAGTSISAMARESGISKESIYRYFSSKETLLEAVIEKELEFYGRELEAAHAVEIGLVDLREALIRIAESIAFTLNSDRTLDFRRLIFRVSRSSPNVGEHYFEAGPLQAEAPLVEIFNAHREKTEFEADDLATYFAAMVGHRLVLERECRVNMPSDVFVGRKCRRIVDHFLKAFFKA
ncbi:MAG: TetR/AcrR family transcriptional regulator [Rhodospirillaceae bacterium]|nr:TetR/AcrR family transcriptional regulator [Rhodospirillaceae bacterium]MDE0359614.1 TetR/AcrR family transcriptional regulator [Rhodospirillaceae bacterium]